MWRKKYPPTSKSARMSHGHTTTQSLIRRGDQVAGAGRKLRQRRSLSRIYLRSINRRDYPGRNCFCRLRIHSSARRHSPGRLEGVGRVARALSYAEGAPSSVFEGGSWVWVLSSRSANLWEASKQLVVNSEQRIVSSGSARKTAAREREQYEEKS